MKQGDTVLVHVSKASTAGENDTMQIQFVDPDTNELLRVSMSMLDYARAITGEIGVTATVVRANFHNPEPDAQ